MARKQTKGPPMSTFDDSKAFERLPAWAKDEIKRLRSNVERANERMLAALGEKETKVQVEPYGPMMDRKSAYLPDHSTVRFEVDGGAIDVQLRDGKLEISGSGVRGVLVVFPRASNLVHVTLAE